MNDNRSADHVEETIQHLAELHQQHQQNASSVQRWADRVTDTLGRPGSIVAIFVITVLWVAGNGLAVHLGSSALERFPFPDLALIATVAAVFIALLILTTQRHADELAEKRAQLTLQIAVLSEKKIAKIIELLEEQRRDNPLLVDRHDEEAQQMAQAVDPAETLARLEESQAEASERAEGQTA